MKLSGNSSTHTTPTKPFSKEDLDKWIEMLADDMVKYFKDGPWEPLARHYGFSFKAGDALFLPEDIYRQLCAELKIDRLPDYIVSSKVINDAIFIEGFCKGLRK